MLQRLGIEKILVKLQMMLGRHQDWQAWGRELEDSILNTHSNMQGSLFARILSSDDPKVQRSFRDSELRAEGIFLMLAGMI